MSTEKMPEEKKRQIKSVKNKLKSKLKALGVRGMEIYYTKKGLASFKEKQSLEIDTNVLVDCKKASPFKDDLIWLENYKQYSCFNNRFEHLEYYLIFNKDTRRINWETGVRLIGNRVFKEEEYYFQAKEDWLKAFGYVDEFEKIQMKKLFKEKKEKKDYKETDEKLEKIFEIKKKKLEEWLAVEIFQAIDEAEEGFGKYGLKNNREKGEKDE